MADEAFRIGPAPARESYLVADKILEAARASGAQAIHPGYGFLSENADFAEACEEAGIVFIGPPASAIRAMGSKSAAKALMEASGVPLAPGYHGESQEMALLAREADRIGFPVLVKASAGGGGKGMRIVERAADLEAAIVSAKREAASAFGNDQVLIERYLTRPRHIEVQVFGDSQGNIVSLFERDCSIQRRHQKVVEEAPAPGLSETRREAICEAARAAARAVGYVGAGTVEFIAEGEDFYFMEMNTRLQVEHPVTEAITGQDLVEWQLLVASGRPLPLRQDQLTITGHALEVRVYAEDPWRDFAPSTGKLTWLRPPGTSANVRVDTGVREGDAVSVHYDPMIAKLIVWDRDRDSAVRRLSSALADYEIAGVQTNVAFLKAIVDHPAFMAAELDTGFIGRHGEVLTLPKGTASARVLAAATLKVLLDRRAAVEARAAASGDPYSPWNLTDAWRPNGDGWQDILFADGELSTKVRAHAQAQGRYLVDLPDGPSRLEGAVLGDGRLSLQLNDTRMVLSVAVADDLLTVIDDGSAHTLRLVDTLGLRRTDTSGGSRLTAPMPGKIVHVFVANGASVKKGAPLLVLEAMKMEHTITATQDGVVAGLGEVGDLVDDGAVLVSFEEAPS